MGSRRKRQDCQLRNYPASFAIIPRSRHLPPDLTSGEQLVFDTHDGAANEWLQGLREYKKLSARTRKKADFAVIRFRSMLS